MAVRRKSVTPVKLRETTPDKRTSSNLIALESQPAMGEEIKELEGTKTNAELLAVINEALESMKTPNGDYSSFYKDAVKFDPVSKVVDILLDQKTTTSGTLDELEAIQKSLNSAITLVSANRYQEFNDIIYSFEPIDKQMKGIRQFVDELSESSDTIRKELEG